MSKIDQLRALREQSFKRRSVTPSVNNAIPRPKAVNNAVNNASSNAQRQAKWRKANADLNRERARIGMRKRRAAAKGASLDAKASNRAT